MSGIEIREKINENNARIQAALDKFILNEEIQELMRENDKIRAQCHHNFIDGVCEYCDGFEGAIYDD